MRKSTHTPEYDLLRSELLRIRRDAKLSQRELASRLRVPHSWVAKVESGERRIDVVELCWFLVACGIDAPTGLDQLARKIAVRPTNGTLKRRRKL